MELPSDVTIAQGEKAVERSGRTTEKGSKSKKDRARSSSREVMGDLETRVAKMEIALADFQGTVEDMSENTEGDESGKGVLEAEVQELKSSMGNSEVKCWAP